MHVLRVACAAVAVVALAVPVPGIAAPTPAALLDTREFLAGVTVAGDYEYTIFAWRDRLGGDDVHVSVSRSHWRTQARQTEDAILRGENSLTLIRDGDRFAIAFEATLPEMGRFEFELVGEAPAPRHWSRGTRSTVASPFALETSVNALSSGQIAGGAGTGFLYAVWGTNATGFIQHAL